MFIPDLNCGGGGHSWFIVFGPRMKKQGWREKCNRWFLSHLHTAGQSQREAAVNVSEGIQTSNKHFGVYWPLKTTEIQLTVNSHLM